MALFVLAPFSRFGVGLGWIMPALTPPSGLGRSLEAIFLEGTRGKDSPRPVLFRHRRLLTLLLIGKARHHPAGSAPRHVRAIDWTRAPWPLVESCC